jgi:hypothetical protein
MTINPYYGSGGIMYNNLCVSAQHLDYGQHLDYSLWKVYACEKAHKAHKAKKAYLWTPQWDYPTASANWGWVTSDPPITSVTVTGCSTWPSNVSYQMLLNCSYGNASFEWNCVVETEEQRLAREAREMAARIKREAATKRAEELLLVCLTEEQRKQYTELGYFETLVNDKVYRINRGRSGNVQLIEGGVPKAKFCIHPRAIIPDQDTMLAQLLMLRTDEAEFLRVANRTILHP